MKRNLKILELTKRLAFLEKELNGDLFSITQTKRELQILMNECPLVTNAKPLQAIELNGVANIMLIVDSFDNEAIDVDSAKKISEQLELLERYMIALNKSIQDGTKNPQWHEVRANPILYPTNREKLR